MRRCPQCYLERLEASFVADDGSPRKLCKGCRSGRRPRASDRIGLDADGELRVRVVQQSKNRKLGGIPSTITSAVTCPPSCGFFGKGCYAEYSYLKWHWKRTAVDGSSWSEFLAWVEQLPAGQLWRHNVAGDLPGKGDLLDLAKLRQLAAANARAGARGFTYTHKPLNAVAGATSAIAIANVLGFTVNLSADSLAEADRLLGLGVAPVVVVLPYDAPKRGLRTPGGAPVAVCPAQTHEGVTCASCGVCQRPKRTGVIGFLAHGQSRKTVSATVDVKRQLPLFEQSTK